ncbi:MAG: phosphoribosylamine--glycine ligase, partial [Clostridia bacterium]|nr:phosphoribosylamine--glycine ligase [Clostridia bacterium]
VLPRLKTDFLSIVNAVIDEKLDTIDIEWEDGACVCVVAASGGYPTKYAKGYEIKGLDTLAGRDDIMVYHAGTDIKDGKLVTSGGRVLGVTAKGANLDEAIAKAYDAIKAVEFTDMHYRRDIGVK